VSQGIWTIIERLLYILTKENCKLALINGSCYELCQEDRKLLVSCSFPAFVCIMPKPSSGIAAGNSTNYGCQISGANQKVGRTKSWERCSVAMVLRKVSQELKGLSRIVCPFPPGSSRTHYLVPFFNRQGHRRDCRSHDKKQRVPQRRPCDRKMLMHPITTICQHSYRRGRGCDPHYTSGVP